MTQIDSLRSYSDESGNEIATDTEYRNNVKITFHGKNNRILVAPGTKIGRLNVTFDGDNGTLILGHHQKAGWMQASIRVGQDSTVRIGNNVSTTGPCVISAVEGATVTIGDDVMIASGNQFRSDDAHPIFDVTTGKRVNHARDITIGNHVWFAYEACALAGARVGDGSVIGFKSTVTGKIPNNVVAVGSPARVVRKDIVWERPHLSNTEPFYKPDASTVTKSDEYWNLTETEKPVVVQLSRSEKVRKRGARVLRRLADRLE